MNIGYYFHPPAVFSHDGQTCKTEAHWALFVRALAAEAGQVTFYAHSGRGSGVETMELGPQWNIRCVDLGPRRRRPLMFLFPGPSLRRFQPVDDGLDALIVRGPTALLPPFARRARKAGLPFLGLLVANATLWTARTGYPAWRVIAIRGWLHVQAAAHAWVGRRSLMMAISRSIVTHRNYRRVAVVPTTSLTERDLAALGERTRKWPDAGEPIRLLFTGRIKSEKGLFELCDALAQLRADGRAVELDLYGPTYDDATLEHLVRHAEALGVRAHVHYKGFVEAGPELLAVYDTADIFVMPTHAEGSVNRSIKEAFAARLPVVTTAIPSSLEFLEDGVHAILVNTHDHRSLARGIAQVIDDAELRARMVAAARDWVSDYTNEASARIVVGHVRDEIGRAQESRR